MRHVKLFENFEEPKKIGNESIVMYEYDRLERRIISYLNHNYNIVDLMMSDTSDIVGIPDINRGGNYDANFGNNEYECYINYESANKQVQSAVDKLHLSVVYGSTIDVSDLDDLPKA